MKTLDVSITTPGRGHRGFPLSLQTFLSRLDLSHSISIPSNWIVLLSDQPQPIERPTTSTDRNDQKAALGSEPCYILTVAQGEQVSPVRLPTTSHKPYLPQRGNLVLRESGCKKFPIWLLGDSSPPKWRGLLHEPLDPRHPARHNIWTPILEGIQEHVYCCDRRRMDDSHIYVRNAINNAEDKPSVSAAAWCPQLLADLDEFGKLLRTYGPTFVFTFGAFACEFSRRSLELGPRRSLRYWTTARLGEEFRNTVEAFNPREVNIFPLLHVSIARGHFLKSHQNFTRESNGNYFDFVSEAIGELLLRDKDKLNVWGGSYTNSP